MNARAISLSILLSGCSGQPRGADAPGELPPAVAAECRDGIVEAPEQCEEPAEYWWNDLDGCTSACRFTYATCGNGSVDAGEICYLAPPAVHQALLNTRLGTVADLDADGDLDVVMRQDGLDAISVWWNDGGVLTRGDLMPAGSLPLQVIAGDFDGDSDLDLAVTAGGSRSVLLFRNTSGAFTPATAVAALDDALGLAAGDFDDDGDLDLAVGYDAGVVIAWNDGTGTFPSRLILPTGGVVSAAGAVDLDADGDDDLAAYSGGELLIFSQVAPGILTSQTFAGYPVHPSDLHLADVDLDGDQDVVFAANSVVVLYNDGSAGFDSRRVLTPNSGHRSMALVDFDHAAGSDFVVAASEYVVSLTMAGDGVTEVTFRAYTPDIRDVAIFDADLDGVLDLVVIGRTVSVFYGFQ